MIFKSFAAVATLASAFLAGSVDAQFNLSRQNNTVVYWGQNAAYETYGTGHQKDLLTTCRDRAIDVVVISFVTNFKGKDGWPILNLSDQCWTFMTNQTTGRQMDVLECPTIGAHIKQCQAWGKKVLLSLGGATYRNPGWATVAEARSAANDVFAMFAVQDAGKPRPRPFGDAIVDGFDLDFEFAANKPNTNTFAALLEGKYKVFPNRKFYLTAAPQCPNPDAALDEALRAVNFDAVFIQFYNNYCQVHVPWQPNNQGNYNMAAWQTWATTRSKNPNIKLFLGMLGNNFKGTTGYIARTKAREFLTDAKKYKNFGGASFWDISGLNTNDQYLNAVRLHMTGPTGIIPLPTTTTSRTTTTTSRTTTTTSRTTTTSSTTTTTTTTTSSTTTSTTTTSQGPVETDPVKRSLKRGLKEYVGGGVEFPDEAPAGVEEKAPESLNKFRRRHHHHRRANF